jgi:hypothetical protein
VTTRRFWGASARPQGPALDFSAQVADRRAAPGSWSVSGGSSAIEVAGSLSAGSVGWVLDGEVRRHRWTLTLYVTARRLGPRRPPGVQDFDYRATVGGLTPGRYLLKVVHLYLDENKEPIGTPLVILERSVSVPLQVPHRTLAMLFWLGSACLDLMSV